MSDDHARTAPTRSGDTVVDDSLERSEPPPHATTRATIGIVGMSRLARFDIRVDSTSRREASVA